LYQMTENQLILPDDFFLPFGGKLNKENRWVILANLIPWWKVEEKYAQSFKKSFKGQKGVSVRVALGSLIIQQRLGLSDRETVQQITENPYLQYFIGLPGFQETSPFHPSLMTHFRKRLGADIIHEVNEWIALEGKTRESQDSKDDNDPSNGSSTSDGTDSSTIESSATDSSAEKQELQDRPNHGKLLLDATCAPADIAYPTDLDLLNEAREKLEQIIDVLYAPLRGSIPKPRTYRKKARKSYLSVAKKKNVSPKKLRKAIGQQLRYMARNLRSIASLQEHSSLSLLSKKQYKQLLVIHELYRQQSEMYAKRSHRIEDRIVSIHQPHVRPIVRGKAKANVEFGAKVAISLVDGYAFIEKLQWDNYNEGTTLQEAVEAYRKRFGCYPEAVLADKIYRNRENLRYCKERGIRLSGPKLGRPSEKAPKEQQRLAQQDALERNAIEGKFGEGKRGYELGLIRACLQKTSETVIALQFLVMNLEHRLRLFFFTFFRWYVQRFVMHE
jgi:transposase, IS5 family